MNELPDEVEAEDASDESPDIKARARLVLAMKDAGSSWLQVQQEFGLSRQQARYAYQLGKREKRRKDRRST